MHDTGRKSRRRAPPGASEAVILYLVPKVPESPLRLRLAIRARPVDPDAPAPLPPRRGEGGVRLVAPAPAAERG